jgi:hypothetical protein
MNEKIFVTPKALTRKMFTSQELVDVAYRRLVDGMHDQPELVLAAQLESIGGECPVCSKPFLRVDVDNEYGKFHYFQPDCRCFKRCERVDVEGVKNGKWYHRETVGCGRLLIAERLLGIGYCTSCRGDRREQEVRKAKTGRISARKIAA